MKRITSAHTKMSLGKERLRGVKPLLQINSPTPSQGEGDKKGGEVVFRPHQKPVENLIRPALAGMKPYVPIVPVEVLAQRAGIPLEEVVKLDGNENPYGCSPRVRKALASYPFYHIYPDPEQRELRRALSEYTGFGSEYLLGGAGSDELIDLILRLFVEPGDKVINCPPTFGMYPFSTEVCGGAVVEVSRREDFSVDVAAIKNALDRRTKVIFIASPNNPSGNITPQDDILELVDSGRVVVVDEAYYEFSGVTVAPLVSQYGNLIVLRTFSKWAGLAGLRVGYGIFPPHLVELLIKIKQPYNINAAALVAVLESVKDIDYLRSTVKAIVAERERLFRKLARLKFLKPHPSQANFILCSVLKGEARVIHQRLQERGIFIRYYETPQLQNCLRPSVGKSEHTDALIAALKEVC